jgi:hypothetical protein
MEFMPWVRIREEGSNNTQQCRLDLSCNNGNACKGARRNAKYSWPETRRARNTTIAITITHIHASPATNDTGAN